MTSALLVLLFLFGTPQVITGVYDTSNYQIITDARNQSFSHYVQQCKNLGDGWGPVIFEDYAEETAEERREYHLVRKGVLVFRSCCQYYWVGGSSNSTSFPFEYIADYSGIYRVKLWPCCSPSLGDNSYLSSGYEQGRPVNHIICEKNVEIVENKHKFNSPHSKYELLVDSQGQNYTYWRSRCEDLGDGWAPTVVNSKEELTFISKFHQNISQRYWIGGSTNVRPGRTIKYFKYFADTSGNYSVLLNDKSRTKSSRTNILVSSILCENKIVVQTGLELATPKSNYRKLVVNDKFAMNFKEWKYFCSEIGTGWAPAVINTQGELDFLEEGQKSFSNSVPYWIGGSTDQNDSVYSIPYSSYSVNNKEINGVYVSTVSPLKSPFSSVHILDFYDKAKFNLRAQQHELTAAGILCEQEITISGLEFSSATSQYQKIVGSANNYTYYASKCTELGDGWAPAVLNTKVEHDFIKESQKFLTDAQDYFIGGSVYPEKTGSFLYADAPRDVFSSMPPGYSPIQSKNPVYVSTHSPYGQQHTNNWFSLVSSQPSTTKHGILCEKAKP